MIGDLFTKGREKLCEHRIVPGLHVKAIFSIRCGYLDVTINLFAYA